MRTKNDTPKVGKYYTFGPGYEKTAKGWEPVATRQAWMTSRTTTVNGKTHFVMQGNLAEYAVPVTGTLVPVVHVEPKFF